MHVPGLATKLKHFYARTGLNLVRLADRLKRAPATVSGWVHGSKTNAPENVPDSRFEGLVLLLTETISVSVEDARRLWLGPVNSFAAALNDKKEARLEDFLRTAERAPILSFLKAGLDEARLVSFNPDGEEAPVKASIGDAFGFRLEGPAHAQIVLFVETAFGVHLGVPGPGAQARLDRNGRARVPDAPGVYRFDPPAGRHTFTVMLINRADALSIGAFAGQTSPLSDRDLSHLAKEISELTRADWRYDRLVVDVR